MDIFRIILLNLQGLLVFAFLLMFVISKTKYNYLIIMSNIYLFFILFISNIILFIVGFFINDLWHYSLLLFLNDLANSYYFKKFVEIKEV